MPAAGVLYGKTLPWYQMFGFRLDLPLHRQSAAARFGFWELFGVLQYQYAIVVLLLLGKLYLILVLLWYLVWTSIGSTSIVNSPPIHLAGSRLPKTTN